MVGRVSLPRRRATPAAVVVVACGVALALVGCTPSSTSVAVAEPGDATVVAVVDGDTLEVEVGGDTETVRLLGVDTPETVHPDRPVECFGPEASARTQELLPQGTRVRLERDEEARDRFGRLLAYVHRHDDGTFVNEALLREGFAESLIISPNHAYASTMLAAQDAARAQGAGLWSACADAGSG